MYTNGDCKQDNVKRKIPRAICVLESIVNTTTSIYRHMHIHVHIHVHGHAVGLRHKEERRKERHSKTRTCSMHTLRQGDTCTTKTKKDHMYIKRE